MLPAHAFRFLGIFLDHVYFALRRALHKLQVIPTYVDIYSISKHTSHSGDGRICYNTLRFKRHQSFHIERAP